MSALEKISIKGFKSIKELVDFELSSLNVFIGANGAGKSNLIEFFLFVKKSIDATLLEFVLENGRLNHFLFNGRKTTEKIQTELIFEEYFYSFDVVEILNPEGGCLTKNQAVGKIASTVKPALMNGMKSMATILNLSESANIPPELNEFHEIYKILHPIVKAWQMFHLNDTSKTAKIRHTESVMDDEYLRGDAANLAPFLLKLKNHYPVAYKEIIDSIRLVMPYFNDFQLDIKDFGKGKELNLAWTQKGSDYPLSPFHLSDGSIRFIALATALLQPEPPSTIIIDEPELGLHPEAIHVLAELIKDASNRTQVIVATQSPILIDNFGVKDIVVVNRKNGASTFSRLNENDFKVWLEDYSVGELWTKNVIAGGPVSE